MMFPPSKSDLIDTLNHTYPIRVKQIKRLPIGADTNSTVYKVEEHNGRLMFLKLRRGEFNEPSVTIPGQLSQTGVAQIIPPIKTNSGQLWADGATYKLLLSTFVDGKNGYETDFSPSHWGDFGTALRKIHSFVVPTALKATIKREHYSAEGRESVLHFLNMAQNQTFADPIGQELANLLIEKRYEVEMLIDRAADLAKALKSQSHDLVICHADLHAGNLLINSEDQQLFIIDWDELILAPKERDLMFVGGSLLASGLDWKAEEALFYQAYGRPDINIIALAYYRIERIIQDIFEYCKELLLSAEGRPTDRRQSLIYLQSNFEPGSTISAANRAWEFI